MTYTISSSNNELTLFDLCPYPLQINQIIPSYRNYEITFTFLEKLSKLFKLINIACYSKNTLKSKIKSGLISDLFVKSKVSRHRGLLGEI